MNNSRLIHYDWPIPAYPPGPDTRARSAADSVDFEKLLLSQLPTIEKVVAQVCRRNHLRAAEAEDFASEVKLHFIERDYEVLRRFRQRSAMSTYVTVVVNRWFVNYCNRVWGRWRPSAEGKRLGATAIQLERLIVRDGWSVDEAQEQLRTNYGVTESRDELQALWIRLAPNSSRRRIVSEELAAEVPSNGGGPDADIFQAERDDAERRAREALERALLELPAEDRLLLQMRFADGFTVSEIARVLHLPQKPLYRRFERLCERLKQRLEADGVSSEVIRKMFDDSCQDGVRFDIHRTRGKGRG
jgi:RNA polymerase sigma factor (sigma-70 family)